jgi:hypothetical protein
MARPRYPSDDRPRIPGDDERRELQRRRQAACYRSKHPGAKEYRPAEAKFGATSCNEYIYSPDELEFLKAMMDHKARTGKQFPTLTEIFHVLLSLGYRKP